MQRVLLLILTAVLCSAQVFAQSDAPAGTTYYQVTKLKNPQGDLMQVERNLMLPYFQARVNDGKQLWHALYQLQSPTGDEADFDYVSVDVFSNLTDLNLPPSGQNEVVTQTFPHTTPQQFWDRVEAVSEVQSIETYTLEASVDPAASQDAGDRNELIVVNYMLVPPGSENDYLTMEKEVFQPVMQEHLKEGRMKNWSVFRRMLPGGTDFGPNYVTVDAFEDWAHMEDYNAEFYATAENVHPGKDLNEIAQRLNELRDFTRSEVWPLRTETTPPSTEEISYKVIKEGTGATPLRGQEVTWSGKVMNGEEKTLFQTASLGENWQDLVGADPYDTLWNKAVMMVGEGGVVQATTPVSRQPYGERQWGGNTPITFRIQVEKVGPPVKYGHEDLHDMITEKGLEAAKVWYAGLKRDNPEGYVFREFQMNALGYDLMGEGKEEAAIFVLDVNRQNYPDSYNTYDSLADAYSNAGNDFEAIKHFKMALQKNPESTATAEKLSKLK